MKIALSPIYCQRIVSDLVLSILYHALLSVKLCSHLFVFANLFRFLIYMSGLLFVCGLLYIFSLECHLFISSTYKFICSMYFCIYMYKSIFLNIQSWILHISGFSLRFIKKKYICTKNYGYVFTSNTNTSNLQYLLHFLDRSFHTKQ